MLYLKMMIFYSDRYLGNGERRMAMRWNGYGDDPGYPKLFKTQSGSSLMTL